MTEQVIEMFYASILISCGAVALVLGIICLVAALKL